MNTAICHHYTAYGGFSQGFLQSLSDASLRREKIPQHCEKGEDQRGEDHAQDDERPPDGREARAHRLLRRDTRVQTVDRPRDVFIDEDGDERRHKAAERVEGQHGDPEIEIIKIFARTGREERRHHAEERLPAPAEHKLHIERHEHQPVGKNGDRDRHGGTRRHTPDRAFERAVLPIDEPCGQAEGDPDDDIGKIAHKHGTGGDADELDEHHHDDDDAARRGTKRKRADEHGNVCEFEFEKSGECERDRKIEDVQHRRKRRKERQHRDARGGKIAFYRRCHDKDL